MALHQFLYHFAMLMIGLTLFSGLPNLLTSVLVFSLATGERIQQWIDRFQQQQQQRKRRPAGLLLLLLLLQWLKLNFDLLVLVASFLVEVYATVWHDHQVVGLENIPAQRGRPALIVVYHGILADDIIFTTNKLLRKTGRFTRNVGDRFLFLLGVNLFGDYLFPGPVDQCVRQLRAGHLVVIAPGGTREAQFATSRYETLWNGRTGYARVAQQAGVDIIPVFTRNIRQVYLLPECLQRWLRPLYERTRLPVVPFLGGFPVKLTTYVGRPIPCDAAKTPEELARLVQRAMDELIARHQTFPATILGALAERFW